jgi:hypothetical protein
LPLCKRTPNFWKKCLMDVDSRAPHCLAMARAMRTIWVSASECHPPKVSTGRGTNSTPTLWHSSYAVLIFLCLACSRAWPGLSAERCRRDTRRGLMTVTLRAASRSLIHEGRKTSAGRLLPFGKRLRSSRWGFRAALCAAV